MNVYLSCDKICRACLTDGNGGELKSMFDESQTEFSIRLSEMFMECTAVHVSKDDGYPWNLCTSCIKQLNLSYQFREKCVKSDFALQLYGPCNIIPRNLKFEQSEETGDCKINLVVEVNTEDDNNVDSSSDSIETVTNTRDTRQQKCKNKRDIEQINAEIADKDEGKSAISLKPNRTTEEESKSSEKEPVGTGPPYTCQKCDVSFEMDQELATHYESKEHTHYRTKVPCTVCGKSFVEIRHHMRIHRNERLFVCDVCGKGFKYKQYLKKHKMIHTGERPHVCPMCNQGFIQKGLLDKHIRNHTGEKPFSCKICGKAFKIQWTLKLHQKTHEPKTAKVQQKETSKGNQKETSKRYPCEICQKTLSSKGTLFTHLKIHGDKKHLCSQCGKSFISSAILRSHYRTHTKEKPYQCNMCGRAFAQHNVMKTHQRVHTGEKPYSCSICGKNFTQRPHLQYHMRTHSGEKPYPCSVCGKGFAANRNLQTHMRQHSGEQSYRCSVCNKGFYDPYSMKKHQKRHGCNNTTVDAVDPGFAVDSIAGIIF